VKEAILKEEEGQLHFQGGL